MGAPDASYLQARKLHALTGLQHHPLHLRSQLLEVEARVHRAHENPGSLLQVLRTRDHDRMTARTLPHIFQKQERQTAKMISMQMAYDDRVELVGFDPVALQLGKYAGTSLKQDALAGRFEQIAG